MTISKAYEEHMKKEHDGSQWGTTGWKYAGDLMVRSLTHRPYIKTVLDFGCGKGTMKPYIQESLPTVSISEYDPGIPGKDTPPTGPYDAVISSDVMEHIEPHLLDDTILQIADLTATVMIHDIACTPTGKTFGEGPYIGQDLHLIVEEPEWWRDRFTAVLGSEWRVAEFMRREKDSHKGVKIRGFLVIERVG